MYCAVADFNASAQYQERVYAFDQDTRTWGSSYQPETTSGQAAHAVDFSPSEAAVVYGYLFDQYLRAWVWDNDTQYGSGPHLSTNTGQYYCYDLQFHPDGDFLAATTSNGQDLVAYGWDDATFFGTKYQPATASLNSKGLDWHPNGNYLAVAGNNPNNAAYAWDDATQFGATRYTPATQIPDDGWCARFHPDGDWVFFHNWDYIYAYAWDDATQFGGTRYTGPKFHNRKFNVAGNGAFLFGCWNDVRAVAWDDATQFGATCGITGNPDHCEQSSDGELVFTAEGGSVCAHEWDDATHWGSSYVQNYSYSARMVSLADQGVTPEPTAFIPRIIWYN